MVVLTYRSGMRRFVDRRKPSRASFQELREMIQGNERLVFSGRFLATTPVPILLLPTSRFLVAIPSLPLFSSNFPFPPLLRRPRVNTK